MGIPLRKCRSEEGESSLSQFSLPLSWTKPESSKTLREGIFAALRLGSVPHSSKEVPTVTRPHALESLVFLNGSGLNKSKHDYC